MLIAENIHKTYSRQAKELHVLKGIGLTVDKGEVLAIVGPSGAGKSTLLHILGGLDRPDDGIVSIDGDNVYKLNDVERARVRNNKIGLIFQFYHLLPEFSALENVILPMLIKQDKKNMDSFKEKGIEILDIVGLKDRQDHKPSELSGGEQQRVAIARSLVNEPKIIFCDEPTGNLDSASGEVVIQLLLKLNENHDQTLVIVTHDEQIARRAGRIIHMKDGSLID